MKANQPKRKLFNDAVDLLTGDAPDSGIHLSYIRGSGWMIWWIAFGRTASWRR